MGLAGFYGSAPVTNVHVANSSASVLLAAVDKIKINSGKLDVFCFCDYGTGEWDSIHAIDICLY